MPVEDLGLNVFVEGFQKFEKQMDMMDTSIDELVKDWRGMVAPAAQAARSIDDIGKEAVQTAGETKKLSAGQKILGGAMEHVGRIGVDFVRQLPRMATEMVKMGAASKRQAVALDSLAASTGSSGQDITRAIQSASSFTIDRMAAMSAASKAMMLDVAKSPEQFERLTKVAVTLGRAMGVDAVKSIDDFVTAAGRQSVMIADNLGLTIKVGEANEMYAKKLGKTVKELTAAEKKQGFLNAMLEAGEKKTAALGPPVDDAATKIEKLTAAVTDAKTGFAELAAGMVSAAGDVDKTAESIRTMPDRLKATTSQLGFLIQSTLKGVESTDYYREAMEFQHAELLEGSRSYEAYISAVEEAGVATLEGQEASEGLSQALTEAEWTNRIVTKSEKALREERMQQKDIVEMNLEIARQAAEENEALGGTVDSLADKIYAMGGSYGELAVGMEDARKAQEELALATEEFALETAMTWKDYFDDTEERQEKFASDREEIETEHQEKLAELQKKGQATLVQINATAEEERLADLKRSLELALLEQSEYSGNVKESTRKRKEDQIAKLQDQISSQETMLNDYYNGRLIRQGEDITADLAAEEGRYADELEMLEKSRAAQEEEQRESLGRMLLQQFEAWSTLRDIPAEKAIEMRTAIALEYGLMDEESARVVTSMAGQWEVWADGFDESAVDVIGDMDAVIEHAVALQESLDRLPRKVPIEILVSTRGGVPGIEVPEFLQRGTRNFRGGLALLGERGPELAVLPRATRVFNAVQTRNIENNYNLTAQSLLMPGALQMEFMTMEMASR